jgi:hypothetical protein
VIGTIDFCMVEYAGGPNAVLGISVEIFDQAPGSFLRFMVTECMHSTCLRPIMRKLSGLSGVNLVYAGLRQWSGGGRSLLRVFIG